jgi:hypothetical protein
VTEPLDRALEELVPSFAGEQGDWHDVAARAGARRSTRGAWRRHPRRLVAGAGAGVLIALLATPAFGVQGYVLHLLGRKNVSFPSSPTAPNVVKKQFLDLPVGAPQQFGVQVEAAQTRLVATFPVAGRRRKLWVAPTRAGGYCYTFESSFGGCRQSRRLREIGGKAQFGVTWMGGSPRRGVNESIVTRVGGDITAPTAYTITASYADGTTHDVPFVWVSKPIAAGFFTYDIPASHWNRVHRLVALTLSTKGGRRLGRVTFRSPARPRLSTILSPSQLRRFPPRRLPVSPGVPPTAPTQSGAADGYRVVVGHNGSVQFTQVATTPILRELAGRSVGFGCFRLATEFGIFTVRGLSVQGRLAPRVGLRLSGVGSPVDGCEIQSSIGRSWPDRLHDRAAVEIPLTAAGRRYFADRAAARDLGLFVRSARVHRLRREPAVAARRDIVRAYGTQLANSPLRITVVDPSTLRFSERSTTGRVFAVTVRRGHIAAQNLKPYALVF